MIRSTLAGLFGLGLTLLTWSGAWGDSPPLAPDRFPVEDPDPDVFALENVAVDWNHSPFQANPQIERAILVIHSSGRDATDAKQWVLTAADSVHPTVRDKTLVLAPQFLDVDEGDLGGTCDVQTNLCVGGVHEGNGCFDDAECSETSVLAWDSGWRFGNSSEDINGMFQISSYEVLDQMIRHLAHGQHFPNLKQIVVLGHSAGGQAANGYAASGRAEVEVLNAKQIPARYVASAPGKKVYMDVERWSEEENAWVVPEAPDDCDGNYDQWSFGYGLAGLNGYAGAITDQGNADDRLAIRWRYELRKVVMLVGSEDTTVYNICWQGATRVESHTLYQQHLKKTYDNSEPILTLHDFVTVPNADHDTDIYDTPEARLHIFWIDEFYSGFEEPCPDPCPDWQPAPDDTGGDLVVSGGDLIPSAVGTSAGVYRRLDFDKPIRILAVIGATDDLALNGGRFDHHFMVLSDGNRSSGYGFAVERSGTGSSDSRVTVYDNGAAVASIPSTFDFVDELEIDATIFTDGRVEGSVVEDGNTFTFDFGAYGFRSTGHEFLYHTDWNAPGSTKPPRLASVRAGWMPRECPDAPSPPDGDADGIADECDNCVSTWNGPQDDADLDGIGDACDNCPEGYNPRQGAAVFSQTLYFDDVDTLSWAAPTDVEVMRGDLASVNVYASDYVVPHAGASTYVDAAVPSPGAGFYFLLKPGGTCASSSWQTRLGEQPERDATLP